MKKLLKSKKALSPVVAAIILIAVTVAVSIAVAAWMGALTFSFMGGTEQVEVDHITWASSTVFTIQLKSTGTASVTVDRVPLNQVSNTTNATLPEAVAAGLRKYYLVTFTWTAGDNYDIAVVTSKGNAFTKRVTGGVNY